LKQGGKESDVVSVAVRSGKLEARFKSGDKVLSISSKETFNDDLFHSVVIIRNGRKYVGQRSCGMAGWDFLSFFFLIGVCFVFQGGAAGG